MLPGLRRFINISMKGQLTMSVLTPTKTYKPKVRISEYIRNEDKPAEETKTTEEDTSAPKPEAN